MKQTSTIPLNYVHHINQFVFLDTRRKELLQVDDSRTTVKLSKALDIANSFIFVANQIATAYWTQWFVDYFIGNNAPLKSKIQTTFQSPLCLPIKLLKSSPASLEMTFWIRINSCVCESPVREYSSKSTILNNCDMFVFELHSSMLTFAKNLCNENLENLQHHRRNYHCSIGILA